MGRDRREKGLDGRVLRVEEARGGCVLSLDGTGFPTASHRCPGSSGFAGRAGQGVSDVPGGSPITLWTVLCWAKSELNSRKSRTETNQQENKIIMASWLPSGQEIGCLLQMPVGRKKIPLGRVAAATRGFCKQPPSPAQVTAGKEPLQVSLDLKGLSSICL